MEVDYIVVGQGISGSLLSRNLLTAGKSVVVIDELNVNSASRIAGGIINPVTGMRQVRSWMIEELMPFAHSVYSEIGKELNLDIVRQIAILDFPASRDAEDTLRGKHGEQNEFVHAEPADNEWERYFRFNYGAWRIGPCLLVDIGGFANEWRKRLKDTGALVEEKFVWSECKVMTDGVVYKNIAAKKIICCEGAGGADNPYFNMLPWSKDKGEALIVSIPGLPADIIFRQGISIVPWHDGLFWVGAAHDWKYTDLQPTLSFREKTSAQLDYWLKLPYTIVDHLAGLRPANLERKPFAGLHPVHKSIGILNGMGGKGVSMAPYFADQLAAHLVHHTPILPAADVGRFAKILSR